MGKRFSLTGLTVLAAAVTSVGSAQIQNQIQIDPFKKAKDEIDAPARNAA